MAKFEDFSNQANSYTELLTSPDGSTSTSWKFPANAQVNNIITPSDIAFKPGATPGIGTYVITGDVSSAVYTAPENLSSLARVALSGLSTSGQSVVFADDLFVMATANGKIFTSPNGTAWTQNNSLPVAATRFNAIHHDGTTFVAVGS